LALLTCVSAFAVSAVAAEVPSEPAVDGAVALDSVIVTGVRGARRTIADSPAPVDVISGEQLLTTGKVGLKEVLNTLIPSFNLPGINGGGTSWSVRAITLRGLNGDQALFLVNGKRRHTTSLINNLARVGRGGVPVDLDFIPGLGHRTHRGAARRRLGAVRLGRHRRGGQHHSQEGRPK
jgi:iron complex outermembrane receptor protein